MGKVDKIESLQILRAIASIFVMTYHLGYLVLYRFKYSYIFGMYWFGYSGVDIFFVLSGFIIYYTNITKNNILARREFLLRRLIRIFPIYWIAIINVFLLYILGTYLFGFSCVDSSTGDAMSLISLLDVLRIIFLIPKSVPIVGVAWTLSFEITFYLLFGLLFFRNSKLFLLTMIFWIISCFSASLIFHLDYESNKDALKSLFNPIVAEFLFGCLVAILAYKYTDKYSKRILLLGLVFFTISALALKNLLVPIPTTNQLARVFVFGLPAALIVYGALYIRSNVPKLLIYLGDASYSIYLFHYPILGGLVKLILTSKLTNYFSNFWGVSVILIVATSICCFIHSYIEKPILNFGKRKIDTYISKLKCNSAQILVDGVSY